MVLNPNGQLARSRAFNNEVLGAWKSETQIVRIVFDQPAFAGVTISAEALRDQIDPALCDVTARRDELDLVCCGDERQDARACWSNIDRDALLPGAEILVVPEIK